MKMFTNNF